MLRVTVLGCCYVACNCTGVSVVHSPAPQHCSPAPRDRRRLSTPSSQLSKWLAAPSDSSSCSTTWTVR
uniref:Secreted protein n=1 Tax=Anguilla anguilla TaxID=7936 RepID=A0A0E9UJR9_ANGAN